jgi:iron complex outermembrane recepter protein
MLLTLWLLSMTAALAQLVRGRVTDATTNTGLPGVTVVAVGSSTGATTDASGDYTLRVAPGNYTLRFSYVGYTAQDVTTRVTEGATVTVNAALSESASKLNEVVVVGSRATTARTNLETVSPVDVVTTREMKSYGQVDVSQILNFVAPSFNSNRQSIADGTDHIDPASLRGLGPDQVLVLVNGKRRHNTALININGTVGRGAVGTDMNVIPVAAIERIEVLRDGAAAQYGSDAIAGVINVVLKKDYRGFTASLLGGQNMTSMAYTVPNLDGTSTPRTQNITDGQQLQFDFSKGFGFGKGGKLTVSGQVVERGRSNRSGLDNAPTIYLGASGGFPATTVVPVAGRAQLLADDAALVQQRGYNRQNIIYGNSSSRNYGIFINGSLPLGSKSELYAAGGVTYRTGSGYGNNRIPVSRNQQPLRADGTLYYPDGFLPAIQSIINDQSLIAGIKTKLGDWNADLSNTYGRNTFRFDVLNSGNSTLPSGNDQQTQFYAGTLKFSQNTTNLDFSRPFAGSGAAKNLNLAFGAEFRQDQFQIVAGEENSYIGLVKAVPTAPITLTTTAPGSGTTLAVPGAQVFPGYQKNDEIDRSRTNLSLYADAEGEIGGRLLLDVAGRYENYSDFGSKLTGKLAGRLKITEAFALRGAISTGFRAPSLQQRYFQNTSTQFVNGNPSNTLTVNNDNDIARKVVGVDALRPETSVNYTAGLTGRVGRSFSITVDAYQIDLTDRILYSGAFSRALLGFGATDYPGVNVVRFFANAANTSTRGIDVVATERLKAGPGTLTLTVALNFNRNKVTAINTTPLINDPKNNEGRVDATGVPLSPDNYYRNLFFDRSQIALLETGQPQNKINLSAAYTVGKFDITVRSVRFGSVTNLTSLDPYAKNPATGAFYNSQFLRDADTRPLLDQTFSPIWITDLTLGYRFGSKLTLSVGANNILDVYPNQIFVDPRNSVGSVDYSSGRDLSNRGRLLFPVNQGGFNGRFVFTRLSLSL